MRAACRARRDLLALREDAEAGRAGARAALESRTREAVAEAVRRQVEIGVDMANDGEMGKASYSAYVADRLSGFGGAARRRRSAQDLRDFPRYGRRLVEIGGTTPAVARLACIGPVAPADRRPLRAELEDFRRAVDAARPAAAFLTAASPGTIAIFMENQHYPSHDAYVAALADAMREEYEAIAAAGFVLQIDAPDLAMGRHLMFKDSDEAGFLAAAAMQVEAINHATANIPPERMRLHLCWGNYQGPHHRDIPPGAHRGYRLPGAPGADLGGGRQPAPRVRMDRAPRLAPARRQGVDSPASSTPRRTSSSIRRPSRSASSATPASSAATA